MATRLERLISLLESGSSQAVRYAAAKQIGELAKIHPDEIHSLLSKVCILLKHKTWETRVAASQAVACICCNVPQYKPTPEDEKLFQEDEKAQHKPSSSTFLQFATFSMETVLSKGTILLAAEHSSVPHKDDELEMDDDEDIDDYILGSHVVDERAPKSKRSGAKKIPETSTAKKLSAREKYLMKKEKKVKEQQQKRKEIELKDESMVTAKKMKTVVTEQPQTEQKLVIESVIDKQASTQRDKWLFHLFTEQFKQDLTSPNWETRHGAALGLKSVLQYHAMSAGKTIHVTEQERTRQNDCWLEDCCIRLLCVFALDRFADFVSDQVVCPVREACAQTLGIVLKHVKPDLTQRTIKSLLILVNQEHWEVRYGGLLGLKYAVAVRQDVIDNQLHHILDAVIPSLNFSIDDVRSVAADTLHPIAEHIVRLASGKLKQIRDILWTILLDLDDLSAATSSIMKLLAKFYALTGHGEVRGGEIFFSDDLAALVPRLWPFLRHNLMTVRKAAIDMLELITAPESSKKWLFQILPETLRYVFQNIILESKIHIVQAGQRVWKQIIKNVPAENLLKISCTFFSSWVNLLSTTQGASLDISLLLLPTSIKEAMNAYGISSKQQSNSTGKKKRGRPKKGEESIIPLPKHPIKTAALNENKEEEEVKSFDIRTTIQDTEEYILMKIAGASALAFLMQQMFQNQTLQDLQAIVDTLKLLLDSQWAVHKQVASLILQDFFYVQHCDEKKLTIPIEITNKLLTLVAMQDQASYIELQPFYATYINECNGYLQFLMGLSIDVTPYITNQSVTLEHAQELTTKVFDLANKMIGSAQPLSTELSNKQNRVKSAVEAYKNSVVQISTTTIGMLCCAVVAMPTLPAESYILPVVNGLLNTIQRERKSLTIQQRSAESLAQLVQHLMEKYSSLNEQIVTNLIHLLCTTIPSDENEKQNGEETQALITDNIIIQRGATMGLCKIVKALGVQVFEKIPSIWNQSGDILYSPETRTNPEKLTQSLHLIKTIAPSIHPDLYSKLEQLLNDKLLDLIADPLESVAVHAAKTIAILCKVFSSTAMKIIYNKLIPLLSDPKHVRVRQGAVRTLTLIVNTLEMDILPYVVLFVVPLLKRMSDQDSITREMASSCFGNVIKILPLEQSVSSSIPEFEPLRERERQFVEQLLDNSKVAPYEIKVKINAELRQYQKDGVSWMAFLNKFNLHGILCDDMGLGKTLQTLCILASDIEDRRRMYESTQLPEYAHLPSLVVCPPTLVGHWFYEIKKFCPTLTPMQYIGNPQARKLLRSEIPQHDVIIMSYDILRNDVDLISTTELGDYQTYNYCILDEGHIIKNSKTKVTKAVKRVPVNHRLILSGTPIQNNVLELWSLFDFLMPGFLGTEREFNQKYGKPILASRDAKTNSKEQEAGTLALEALHRQVLPFLLRRIKEDVLHDLPEKIIQDYYCELSPLQWRLYEDFSRKHLPNELENAQDLNEAKKSAAGGNDKSENDEPKWHIFQALQYLRKLCNHPLLILNENHPEYFKVMGELRDQNKNLHDICFSPKLEALKELLNQCGLGLKKSKKSPSVSGSSGANGEDGSLETSSAAGHRVLVFAQLKSMLDIIEEDLFKRYMPNLTFMRLDGSVESSKRHALVTKFNSDPTIDVLLLTTHVGGLGLNLTGADTVIFVEHDWNPSADLQAMDRAHRIGQKRVVNVYRLITRNTLEEKIMGLQKFKMNIQRSVVTRENSSLKSMDTAQLVDLFKLGEEKKEAATSANNGGKQEGSSVAAPSTLLKDIGDLWDTEQQYEEFNLDSFMKNMNKK